ncbi:MAG: hypothetical protein JXB30_08865 [Anaerolineae bacterium]|nr:hypothetical protein [Anaerolineae bacterium]
MNNPLSYSSVKLALFAKDGTHLKSVSGFVIEAGDQYYLITNKHVVSGEDMQEFVSTPYILKTCLHVYAQEDEKVEHLETGMRRRIAVDLKSMK